MKSVWSTQQKMCMVINSPLLIHKPTSFAYCLWKWFLVVTGLSFIVSQQVVCQFSHKDSVVMLTGSIKSVWLGYQTLMKLTLTSFTLLFMWTLAEALLCFLAFPVAVYQIKKNLWLRSCREQAEGCWGSWRQLELLMSVRKKETGCLIRFGLKSF